MNHNTQMRSLRRATATQLAKATKRLTKAEKAAQSAAGALVEARGKVVSFTTTLTKLDEALAASEGTVAKPSVARAGKTTKRAERLKPGPKPKAITAKARAVKAKPEKNTSRAAQGRREVASGERQPIKQVIAKVLGKRVMHANDVFEAIKAKDQLPNSGDARGYIGYLLSASKTTIKRGGKTVEVPLFERVQEKGRGFYKNRGVAAPVVVKAAPKKAEAKPAKAAKVKAVAAPKAERKGAPVKDGKRTVTCKVCQGLGHNSKGHAKAVAASKTVEQPKAAPAKAETKPAKDTTGPRRTVTCKVCQQPGHNSKGHAKAVAIAAVNTNGATGHASPAPAAPKVEKVEAAKDSSEMSTDEILASAGIDIPAPL